MSATFWEKPTDQLSYYEKLRRGICPECNGEGVLVVEADYEYVTRPKTTAADERYSRSIGESAEVKQYHTGIRCSKCKKGYLPIQLLPMGERFA